MRLSTRTAVPRQTNALADALAARRRAGLPVLDLTEANPTIADLPYDEAGIRAALSSAGALTYSPSPFGLREARESVAALYAEWGVVLDPSRLVLTASTSEAYALLFKLLCDDGDDVLVPQPSYPLFELLARFEGVNLSPYPLAYDGEWHIDRAALERAITPRTRAILVVSPNNPTGSYVKRDELAALAALRLPIVSDEVFAPFPLKDDPRRVVTALESTACELVFALSGLSKLAGLPQMKLGWIAVAGADQAAAAEALARLELLTDASLSVGTPVQVALPRLLACSHVTRDAIRARLRTNLDVLRAAIASTSITALDVEGGWYATLRLPRIATEEAWTLSFLDDGVYVHPGHFFDFATEAYVVVSLLTPEARFAPGVLRIVSSVQRRVAGEVSSP
jgi:aspartate/methionine/tyrosine aminotransferase